MSRPYSLGGASLAVSPDPPSETRSPPTRLRVGWTSRLALRPTIPARERFYADTRLARRGNAPLRQTGSTAGLVLFSKQSSSAALVLYPIVPSRSNRLAGTRQEIQRSVAGRANDHLPGVQARALLYSAPTGASSRASTRPESRPSPGSRSRGGPHGRQEGGEASPPRKQGSAREGEGRAHRPIA